MVAFENRWKELGVVSDDATGIAALVCVMEGPRPLPGVQFGSLIGPDKSFSPYLHPKVSWTGGQGSLVESDASLSIPSALTEKISALLSPHLVENDQSGIADLLSFDLLEVEHGAAVESALSCLRCS